MNEERRIVVASDSGISIRSFGDISDTIGACIDAKGLILTESDLAPDFFDLRSGLAGELFQKFVNYKLRVAIGRLMGIWSNVVQQCAATERSDI